ncbi:uncharacterized protein LOC126880034 isoform X2 [Diabrotica virgifera virgifera]|uniref:Gustatory receptor n=1 Tax=Diabrotica virgifera virgifera TaxID=50390 RepID=A0ABM5JNR0_DIAVI|nr:uncharacterized protein LOC126880034 isoform X2 [Diabrotica virgifera virgifera]
MAYFYWYFRPWAILLCLVGIFPLEHIFKSDPTMLKYRFFSLSNLYSSFLFVSLNFVFIRYGAVLFMVNSATQKCFQLVVYITSIRALFAVLTFLKTSKKSPTLIKLLHSYDHQKQDFVIAKDECKIKSIFVWTIFPMLMSCFFLISFAIYTTKIAQDVLRSDRDTLAYLQTGKLAAASLGLLSIWYIFPNSLYIYQCSRIAYNFSQLNQSLKIKLFSEEYGLQEKICVDYEIMERYRYLHNMLSECVHSLEYIYGYFLVGEMVAVIAVIVINISVAIIVDYNSVNLIIYCSHSILLMLIVISTTHKLKEEGNEIVNILHRMPTKSISDECLKELQTFMIQIHVRPVEISASGYFTLDKRQILNIITQVSTYLIVVCQLVQSYYQYNNQQNSNSTHIVNTDVN